MPPMEARWTRVHLAVQPIFNRDQVKTACLFFSGAALHGCPILSLGLLTSQPPCSRDCLHLVFSTVPAACAASFCPPGLGASVALLRSGHLPGCPCGLWSRSGGIALMPSRTSAVNPSFLSCYPTHSSAQAFAHGTGGEQLVRDRPPPLVSAQISGMSDDVGFRV